MKVLLRDPFDGQCYWVGEKGLAFCTDMNDTSLAVNLTEDEADCQIDWYSKMLGFQLEFKTE